VEDIMLDGLNESALQKKCDDCHFSAASQGCRELRLELAGDFSASETIERMNNRLQPSAFYERVILDFSKVPRIKPVELYRLFAELATNPHFNYVEICVEGIQFSYEIGQKGRADWR
jgi:hypothetical protein